MTATKIVATHFAAVGPDALIHGIGWTQYGAYRDAVEYGVHVFSGEVRPCTAELFGMVREYGGTIAFETINGIVCTLDEAIAIEAETV